MSFLERYNPWTPSIGEYVLMYVRKKYAHVCPDIGCRCAVDDKSCTSSLSRFCDVWDLGHAGWLKISYGGGICRLYNAGKVAFQSSEQQGQAWRRKVYSPLPLH